MLVKQLRAPKYILHMLNLVFTSTTWWSLPEPVWRLPRATMERSCPLQRCTLVYLLWLHVVAGQSMIADYTWCTLSCLATQSLALELNCTVSISILKKGRHVARPSHLSDSIGVPRSLQICRQVVKLDAHSSESGLPEIINIVEETFYSPPPFA